MSRVRSDAEERGRAPACVRVIVWMAGLAVAALAAPLAAQTAVPPAAPTAEPAGTQAAASADARSAARSAAPSAERDRQDEAAALEGFGEAISVEVVDVDVRVTDRKGRLIRGLSKDDFTLRVDGKQVPVDYFEAVGFDGATKGQTPARTPAQSEPSRDATAEPQAAAENGAPDRHLVIFLDQLHLTTTGRRQLIRDLEPFLDRSLGQGIPVMVASSAGGLRVLQDFTLDRNAVLDVLGREDKANPGGIQERVAQSRTRHELVEILVNNEDCPLGDPCDCAIPQMIATVRNRAAEVTGRVEDTLSAIDTLSAALRGLPGTKTMLLASDGLEFRPGLGLYRMVMDLCPDHEMEVSRNILDTDILPVYQNVTAHAAANRVTIYALDTAGLVPSNGVDEIPGTRLSQRAQTANLEHSLFMLSDETGGEAIFNTNKFDKGLDDISQDIDAYYSLGFTPDHRGEDRVHTIEVEVAGDHHDVRYRKAYRHASLDGRIAERMLGTLLFGVEQNQLGIDASVDVSAEPASAAGGTVTAGADTDGSGAAGAAGELPVTVHVRIPLGKIVLNPKPDGPIGLVRLLLTVQDVNGEWTPTRQKRVPIRVAPGEDPTAGSREVEVEMALRPGDYLLAVGVRDELGGTISYLRKTFTVAPRT